jgi:hypothetical protein
MRPNGRTRGWWSSRNGLGALAASKPAHAVSVFSKRPHSISQYWQITLNLLLSFTAKGPMLRLWDEPPSSRPSNPAKAHARRFKHGGREAKEGKNYIVVKRTKMEITPTATPTIDTSDNAVLALLKRIKATNSRNEVRQLSDQLERVIFHKQYANA